MDDIEFLFDDLTEEDLKSIETLSLNYGVPMDTISDMFTANKFNWERDNSDQFNKQSAPFSIIYQTVRNQLNEDRKGKPGQRSMGGTTAQVSASGPTNNQRNVPGAQASKQIKQVELPPGSSLASEIHKSKKANSSSQPKGGKPGQQLD